ncbi:MAG: Unknown protein [uncultured Sulfurovum sp.]|uniref:Uncharacterized protein n=1 Tax=uncultured Sulfurovum sp. TaxID=269237 RepID=A0A6S6SL41_9BACT|nr:MAG: Unknown protein [uncultured Sulfurovum sp.]
MKLFFSIFVFLSIGFLSVNADSKIVTEDALMSIVEKQDMKYEHFKETTELTLKHELDLTKESLDKTNAYIEHTSDRIDNISAAIDRFAMLTTFFGVLITMLVLFLSLKSNSEAKRTVEEWLEENGDDFVNKEVQPIKENFTKMISDMKKEMEYFKEKSDEEIEKLKRQLEEKGNEAIESLSSKIMENDISDTELSIRDKQYFEYQIKAIKSKPLKQRTIHDYKKIILFYIASKSYLKAMTIVDTELNNKIYTNKEKASLYHLKGLIEGKKNLYDKALISFNKALELTPNLVVAYTAKAKIYNVDRQDYKEAIKLVNKALSLDKDNYDAYIGLAYGTRNKAYFENKHELYDIAIKYNKKAIDINPDFELAYNNIGSIYLMQNKYLDAKKWYLKSLEINPAEWVYINLFRIYLLLDESLSEEIENNYLKEFDKNSKDFFKYEMIKIIQKISNGNYRTKEEIKNEIELLSPLKKRIRHYSFKPFNDWIIKKENSTIKENLKYALKIFDTYRIK